jgi:hypothetical protein
VIGRAFPGRVRGRDGASVWILRGAPGVQEYVFRAIAFDCVRGCGCDVFVVTVVPLVFV